MPKEIERKYGSILSGIEAKTLDYLAKKLHRYITADQLTLLALFGAVLIAISYKLGEQNVNFLLLANFGIFLHWFGDSLDGRTAYLRGEGRPKYGHYLDHILDSFSMTIIYLGINFSSLTNTSVWIYSLVISLLISNHVYLKTSVTKVFDLSLYGPIGATEVRIIFFIVNLIVIATTNPIFTIGASTYTLVDLIGIAALALSVLTLIQGVLTSLWGNSRIPDK